MFIASELRKTNITEYVLYLWQIEDLIRAFDFDIEKIQQAVITPYPIDEEKKKQLREWYESLIDMMNREGVRENGHLQLVKNTVSDMEEMHLFLLRQGKEPAYNAKFYFILPQLTLLKGKNTHPASIGDIEMCLIFLYGIMQLRRQKREISEDTQRIFDEIRKLMILVSKYYPNWQKPDEV